MTWLHGARPAIRWLAAGAALCLAAPPAAAQDDIEEALRELGRENAELYIQPVTDGLGAALNSGFFHSARPHAPGGFDVGLRAMGAFVPASGDFFVPRLPGTVEFGGEAFSDPYAPQAGSELVSPTAVGEGEGLRLVPRGEYRQALLDAGENPADFDILFPEGFDVPLVPYAAVQAAAGVPYGTEVVVRFIPSITVDDEFGSVGMFGLGLKHSLDQWLFLDPPVNLAVAWGWQRFTVGDYLEANAHQWALIASRDLSVLTLYAAGAIEDADLDIEYTVENTAGIPGVPEDGERIAFETDAANAARFTLGGTLALGPLFLNVDYSFSDYDVLSTSLFFGLR